MDELQERERENRGNCVPDSHSQWAREMEGERERQRMRIIVSQALIDRERRLE